MPETPQWDEEGEIAERTAEQTFDQRHRTEEEEAKAETEEYIERSKRALEGLLEPENEKTIARFVASLEDISMLGVCVFISSPKTLMAHSNSKL